MAKEEIYWKQRAKNLWLEIGDAIAKYFHKQASQRHKTNLIKGMKDVNGRFVMNPKDTRNITGDYFMKLFLDGLDRYKEVISCVDTKVMRDINIELLAPF